MLIVGSGGLKGAYSAGVLAELCRKLGPAYFDTIIASSSGAYEATFYVANQSSIMENIWRNYLDSNKLLDFTNKFKGKNILNLDYLSSTFKNRMSKLNIERVIKSKVNLRYVLTNYENGEAHYFSPNRTNIFKLMKASSALFPLHSPVKINKKTYIDGGFSEPLPFRPEFVNEYDKIIVVHSREKGHKERKAIIFFFNLFSNFLPKKTDVFLEGYFKRLAKTERQIKRYSNVFMLQPSKKIPLKSLIDTDKKRLNYTIDLGIKDSKEVIRFLKS